MLDKLKKLNSQLKSKIYFNHDIGKMTWFRTGGKAELFILAENENELEIIINTIKDYNYLIIGMGSNILIRDKGYKGAIIKLGKGFNSLRVEEDKIISGASILDNNLSKFAKNNSIKNLEFFSGIPGTVGGAIKMNAGCFGCETKDVLREIFIIDKQGNKNKIKATNLELNYRTSNINDSDIITSAIFDISYGDPDTIINNINTIKKKREEHQPIQEKTSGSTFKNPKNYFAAELIEKAGCKGMEIGDAIVSDKHSNFIINQGNASAQDIEQLGKKIIEKVFDKFNILLDWEIKLVGD